jgi:hypothetical protein
MAFRSSLARKVHPLATVAVGLHVRSEPVDADAPCLTTYTPRLTITQNM